MPTEALTPEIRSGGEVAGRRFDPRSAAPFVYKSTSEETRRALHGRARLDAGPRSRLRHGSDRILGEIADRSAFLAEARRVLKPGGVLSVSEHLPDPDFTPCAKVRSLVVRAGFEFVGRDGAWWSYTANFMKVRPGKRATRLLRSEG